MNDERELAKNYLLRLGLKPEVIAIYLALYTHGPQTISGVARRSGVERTRIYRLLDELKSSNLLETELHYKRTILRAAPITNSHILLTQKEQDIHDLRDELGVLQDKMASHSLESPVMKVQTYQGIDGLKQMLWNQTRAKTEVISFLSENMQQQTESTFFDRWVRACIDRHITHRSIIGKEFIESQKKWYSTHTNERLKSWMGRFISSDILPIHYSTVIYNDVTTYYHWKDDELFGVEIYNKQIADTQRRLFEMIWALGTDFDDTEIEKIRQQHFKS